MSKDIFYFNRQDRIATVILLAVIVAVQFARIRLSDREADNAVAADSLQWVPETKPARQNYADARLSGNRSDSLAKPVNRYSGSGKGQENGNGYGNKSVRNYSSGTVTVTGTKTGKVQTNDSLPVRRYPVKVRPVAAVDLNAVDSAGLVALPGIGAWTASRILSYRRQLGGYSGVEQLLEIEGLPDSLMQWFVVGDTVGIERIMVNSESLTGLRRHPYLNFYQARAIFELRKEKGRINGPGQLSILEEFTARDLERLKPYLDFR